MKTEPTEPGWYAYSGGGQVMIFLRREYDGQWFAFFDNGEGGKCEWGYIEQALGVWDLVRCVPEAA